MSDPSGSGFFPPLPPSNATPSSTGTQTSQQLSLADLVVRDLPPRLQNIPQTTQIETQVARSLPLRPSTASSQTAVLPANTTAGDQIYQVTLSTNLGDIVLNTRTALQAGLRLNLTLQPGSPTTLSQLQIIAPGNTTQTSATSQLTNTATLAPLQNLLSPNNSLPVGPLRVGGLVDAFILQNVSANGLSSSYTLQGTSQGASQGVQGNLSTTNNASPTVSSLLNSSNLLSPLGNEAGPLGQYQRTIVRIAHFGPPASGFIPPQNSPQSNLIQSLPINNSTSVNAQAPLQTATVITHAAGGTPVLQSPLGHILILTNTSLPVGAQISFQIVTPDKSSIKTAQATQSIFNNSFTANLSLTNWPTLEEITSVTTQQNPLLSTNFQSQIPALSRPVSGLTLFFISALNVTDSPASAWLGTQLTQALRANGQDALINRLELDFQTSSRTVRETISGQEFRSFTLPFQTDESIQPVHIVMRHQGEQDNGHHDSSDQDSDGVASKKAQTVRFLVNLNLSRLGPVQIDGLLKNQKMDMFLRLDNTLDTDVKTMMTERYHLVMETLGLQGQLLFQTTKNWIHFEDTTSFSQTDTDLA
jgi:hypothetical protein